MTGTIVYASNNITELLGPQIVSNRMYIIYLVCVMLLYRVCMFVSIYIFVYHTYVCSLYCMLFLIVCIHT